MGKAAKIPTVSTDEVYTRYKERLPARNRSLLETDGTLFWLRRDKIASSADESNSDVVSVWTHEDRMIHNCTHAYGGSELATVANYLIVNLPAVKLPFAALGQIGVTTAEDVRQIKVIDHIPSTPVDKCRSLSCDYFVESQPKIGSSFGGGLLKKEFSCPAHPNAGTVSGVLEQATLFSYRDKCYLYFPDDGTDTSGRYRPVVLLLNYGTYSSTVFPLLAELTGQDRGEDEYVSIEQALASLKPELIASWESEHGHESIKRQGDMWFMRLDVDRLVNSVAVLNEIVLDKSLMDSHHVSDAATLHNRLGLLALGKVEHNKQQFSRKFPSIKLDVWHKVVPTHIKKLLFIDGTSVI